MAPWAYHAMIGAPAFYTPASDDWPSRVARLVDFLSGGFNAPVSVADNVEVGNMKPILILSLAVSGLWAADQTAGRAPLELSMKRAVELAISPEGSAQIQLSGEALKQAQRVPRRLAPRCCRMFEAALSDQSRTATWRPWVSPVWHIPIPGFQFPHFVGPFNTMDARLTGIAERFRFRFHSPVPGLESGRCRRPNPTSTAAQEQVAAQVARRTWRR